jgi:chromosome segregation ATPase
MTAALETTAVRAKTEIEAELRALRGEQAAAEQTAGELAGLIDANEAALAGLEERMVGGDKTLEKELAKIRTRSEELDMRRRVAERSRARTEPDRPARIAQLEVELAEARRRDELEALRNKIDAGLEHKRSAQRRQIELAAALSQADAEVRAAEASFIRVCAWAESVDGTSRADPFTAISVAPDGATFARLASVAAALGLRLRRDPATQAFVADRLTS